VELRSTGQPGAAVPTFTSYFTTRPAFVIFLCFLSACGSQWAADSYDGLNGMWGETDDEKNWKF